MHVEEHAIWSARRSYSRRLHAESPCTQEDSWERGTGSMWSSRHPGFRRDQTCRLHTCQVKQHHTWLNLLLQTQNRAAYFLTCSIFQYCTFALTACIGSYDWGHDLYKKLISEKHTPNFQKHTQIRGSRRCIFVPLGIDSSRAYMLSLLSHLSRILDQSLPAASSLLPHNTNHMQAHAYLMNMLVCIWPQRCTPCDRSTVMKLKA